MTRKELRAWIDCNAMDNPDGERHEIRRMNNLHWLFVRMNDGWWMSFTYEPGDPDGCFRPQDYESRTLKAAITEANFSERITVPFTVLQL